MADGFLQDAWSGTATELCDALKSIDPEADVAPLTISRRLKVDIGLFRKNNIIIDLDCGRKSRTITMTRQGGRERPDSTGRDSVTARRFIHTHAPAKKTQGGIYKTTVTPSQPSHAQGVGIKPLPPFIISICGREFFMADKSVVRNARCRCDGLNKRERRNERKNAGCMNEDIVKERAAFNVRFKPSAGGYEAAFDAMLAKGAISTRGLGKNPYIVDELAFDVNSAYFANNGGCGYAKSFFEEACRLAVKEIGGEQCVPSAAVHAGKRSRALSERLGRDMYHYHLHVVYAPVVDKEIHFKKNSKTRNCSDSLFHYLPAKRA
ncbi:MAG: plasmid recombination protein [Clostridiales bacterium]|nr:plasmid recombination protein [Clostridiales bacterium]